MKTFANGLSIILPTAIIVYLLLWVLEKTETIFKTIILLFLPEQYYFLGLGFLCGIVFVYLIGLLLKIWIFQKVKVQIDKLINKMPILNSLYGGIQDLFNFTANIKKENENIVVLVDMPALDSKILGFITLKDFENFKNIDLEEYVLVYFQMSYQIGGYSLFVPKKNIEPVDMSIEDSLRFIATAGISKTKKEEKDEVS